MLLKIYGANRSVTIDFDLNPDQSVDEILTQLSEMICISRNSIWLVNAGNVCYLPHKISDYPDPDKFYVMLVPHTPRDLVMIYRCLQKLKGEYHPEKFCVICLDREPNVATSVCQHDAIMCDHCVSQVDTCPVCRCVISGLCRI